MFDKSKFSFPEVFNNSSGKTSGSGFIGVIGSLFCMLFLLVIAILIYFLRSQSGAHVGEVLDIYQSIIMGLFTLAGLYAGLLGLRKWKANYKDGTSEIPSIDTTQSTIDASTNI